MRRKTIIGWVVGTTLIALCGMVLMTPPFQSGIRTWHWMQRYGSVADAREQLKANPDDAKAHLTLAWTLLSSETSGKEVSVKEARHEWEEVFRCDPSNEAATVIGAPLIYMGSHSTPEQHAKVRRLLAPIAQHGDPRMQVEALGWLRALDKDEQKFR